MAPVAAYQKSMLSSLYQTCIVYVPLPHSPQLLVRRILFLKIFVRNHTFRISTPAFFSSSMVPLQVFCVNCGLETPGPKMFTCAEEERDTMPPRGQKRNNIVIDLNNYYYLKSGKKWQEAYWKGLSLLAQGVLPSWYRLIIFLICIQ